MDINKLEEFVVLANSPSYRSAAAQLGISPALLSNHIAALEKSLDTRLFERDAHSLSLTKAGKLFLNDAREISGEYQQMLTEIGTFSEGNDMSIKIGMTGFSVPNPLGPFLDSVNLSHPGINIEIFDDRTIGIQEGLTSGKLDIFFTFCPDGMLFDGIEKEAVYSAKMQVLVPMHHHLAHKTSINLSDLDGERFVLYPETAEPAMHQCELELLQNSGISFSVYEGYVCPSAYCIMVPVGKGIALCPRTMRNMIPPHTASITVNDPNFEVTMYMFYRADNPNPYLPRFIEDFRSFCHGRKN